MITAGARGSMTARARFSGACSRSPASTLAVGTQAPRRHRLRSSWPGYQSLAHAPDQSAAALLQCAGGTAHLHDVRTASRPDASAAIATWKACASSTCHGCSNTSWSGRRHTLRHRIRNGTTRGRPPVRGYFAFGLRRGHAGPGASPFGAERPGPIAGLTGRLGLTPEGRRSSANLDWARIKRWRGETAALRPAALMRAGAGPDRAGPRRAPPSRQPKITFAPAALRDPAAQLPLPHGRARHRRAGCRRHRADHRSAPAQPRRLRRGRRQRRRTQANVACCAPAGTCWPAGRSWRAVRSASTCSNCARSETATTSTGSGTPSRPRSGQRLQRAALP